MDSGGRAIHDGRRPDGSGDQSIPRFTFWDRRGTTEWIELDLRRTQPLTWLSVYWFDDTGRGECRVPAAWRLSWRGGATWRPVTNPRGYGVAPDRFNTTRFDPVKSPALRLEVDLRSGFSGGVLELNVG